MSRPLFRTPDGKSHAFTFVLISSLFLLWGLCNGMIDVMDKHFQDKLHLSKAQSAWVQFAHYMGYCFVALPAGWLARRLGYKAGIVTGLMVVAIGGFWFVPATYIQTFWAFLMGVFILAAGLTFLETIANPYATVLGAKDYAATRINLAQSCNGVGWILGPLIGGMFFYAPDGGNEQLYIPYVCVAVVVLVLAGVFLMAPLPNLKTEDAYHLDDQVAGTSKSIWSHPHFVFAVVAQFLYVASQAGIFAFFINYMVEDAPAISAEFASSWILGSGGAIQKEEAHFISEMGATKLLAYGGFVLFLIGRFTGAGILARFPAHYILGIYAAVNTVLMAAVFVQEGWFSVAALFLSFFFMSIMFPTIFALGIYGLGDKAKTASSFIVMAIMGGALMPKIMGLIGDHYTMSKGFIVPLFCFAGIALYGFLWARMSQTSGKVRIGHHGS